MVDNVLGGFPADVFLCLPSPSFKVSVQALRVHVDALASEVGHPDYFLCDEVPYLVAVPQPELFRRSVDGHPLRWRFRRCRRFLQLQQKPLDVVEPLEDVLNVLLYHKHVVLVVGGRLRSRTAFS